MSGRYVLRVKEQMGAPLQAVFVGFLVENEPEGGAALTGYVADQAELRGLIQRVFDLGLTLLSVTAIE